MLMELPNLTTLTSTVIEKFFKIFISKDYQGYTFIAHYGKGFDMHPVLGELLRNKLTPETISTGNKISYIHLNNINIRFIDSINFTMVPLKKFPSTFEIEGKKGDFPHCFNTIKNQNYIGPYPDKNSMVIIKRNQMIEKNLISGT